MQLASPLTAALASHGCAADVQAEERARAQLLQQLAKVQKLAAKVAYSKHRPAGGASRRRDCHFTDTPSSSILKRLLKGEGGAAE